MHDILNELTNNNETRNLKKNVIKLNENTIRKVVAESVKKVLKEYQQDFYNEPDEYDGTIVGREDIGGEKYDEYAMNRCSVAAVNFIDRKNREVGNSWLEEFKNECANDGLFMNLDDKQIRAAYIQGEKKYHNEIGKYFK